MDESERQEFLDDLISSFNESLPSSGWSKLEKTIDSWRATAEALTNQKLAKIISTRDNAREYTGVE